MAVKLAPLSSRRDFLRVRGGARWSTSAFIIEAKAREDAQADGAPRFGFTVTKALGRAVRRNRIRRRLREAVRRLAARMAQPGFDYVLVARPRALDQPFAEMEKDLEHAFERLHSPPVRRYRQGEHRVAGAGKGAGGARVSGKGRT